MANNLEQIWQETRNLNLGNPYITSSGQRITGESGADNEAIWKVFGNKSMYADLVGAYSDIIQNYAELGHYPPNYESLQSLDPMGRGGVKKRTDYSKEAESILNRLISNTKLYGVDKITTSTPGGFFDIGHEYGGYFSRAGGDFYDFNRPVSDTIFYDYNKATGGTGTFSDMQQVLKTFAHELVHGAGSHLYEEGWKEKENPKFKKGTDYKSYKKYENMILDIFKKYKINERVYPVKRTLEDSIPIAEYLRDVLVEYPMEARYDFKEQNKPK